MNRDMTQQVFFCPRSNTCSLTHYIHITDNNLSISPSMYEVLLFEIHDTLLLSKVLSKGFKRDL